MELIPSTYKALFEAGGAVISAVALTKPSSITPEELKELREKQFMKVMEKGLAKTGRVAFGVKTSGLACLTSSVASEEIHERYLTHCVEQYAGRHGKGCVYCVYGPEGSGKSSGVISLLIQKSNYAPVRAICFGGKTSYVSGDSYYSSLLDDKIGGGKVKLNEYADIGVFSPDCLADTLIDLLRFDPADLEADRGTVAGIGDVPGLKEYLKARVARPARGGSPVLVLDDVNIDGLDKRDTTAFPTRGQQVGHWMKQLGKAGTFFDSLITKGHEAGIIVFVTTKKLEVAQFFQLFNSGKAEPFKEVRDVDNLSCQEIDWNELNRKKFLRLQNDRLKPKHKLSDADIDTIVQNAMAHTPPMNVRDMRSSFFSEVSSKVAAEEFSDNGRSFWDKVLERGFWDYVIESCW